MERSRICICVPYFGGKDWEHDDLIDAARASGYRVEVINNYPYIDQARCYLAERALRLDIDVVFFIDHDMIFDIDDIERMADEALARNAVVAGLYLTRRVKGVAVVKLDPVPDKISCFKAGGLYPCSCLPGGFTAIPRKILEELPVKRATLGDAQTTVRLWFYNEVMWFKDESGQEHGMWMGEDTSFSKRLRDAGFAMFVDTRPRVFHKGSHKFALEDGDMLRDVKFKEVLEILIREETVGKKLV
jgi:hypothetical protein